MNDFSKFKPEDFFAAAKDAKIPENMQQMVGDTVAKSHEAYVKMTETAAGNAKAAEEAMAVAQTGAKELGDKVVETMTANAEAAFEAAQAIAGASTIPEAAKLQADFMQQQMAIAGAQTKDIFELSTKLSQDAFQTWNAMTAKSFEQFKSV